MVYIGVCRKLKELIGHDDLPILVGTVVFGSAAFLLVLWSPEALLVFMACFALGIALSEACYYCATDLGFL
jgi:hypothetical protein